MDFCGNFKDFSFAQLLNLIHLARKSGTLYANVADKRVRLVFADGLLLYARLESGKTDLAEILQYGGQIDYPIVRMIREKLQTSSETEVGIELVMTGVVSQSSVIDCIQKYTTSIIRQIFTWSEGSFEFDGTEKAPEGKILLDCSLDEFISEGISHLSEQEQLLNDIPGLDIVLSFTDRIKSVADEVSVGTQEWQLIANVNTQRSLAEIAQATDMSEYEIRKAASKLIQAGVLQIYSQPETTNEVEDRKESKSNEGKKKGSKIRLFVTELKRKLTSK